jgi:biotin carboxyl carrier protein
LAQEIIEVPITGKVMDVEVKVGDTVGEGDVICYVESMKMENPIVSPVNGKVTEINVAKGEAVEVGKTIAVIEY